MEAGGLDFEFLMGWFHHGDTESTERNFIKDGLDKVFSFGLERSTKLWQ